MCHSLNFNLVIKIQTTQKGSVVRIKAKVMEIFQHTPFMKGTCKGMHEEVLQTPNCTLTLMSRCLVRPCKICNKKSESIRNKKEFCCNWLDFEIVGEQHNSQQFAFYNISTSNLLK